MSGSSVAVVEVVPGPSVHEDLVLVDPPVFSVEQDAILQSVLLGHNVFFTGGAGEFWVASILVEVSVFLLYFYEAPASLSYSRQLLGDFGTSTLSPLKLLQ